MAAEADGADSMTTSCSAHFVHVNGIPTKIMKVDGHHGIGDMGIKDCMEGYSSNVIFLIIPGNPGIADFYELFMETLFKASDHRVPVWTVSHAGHIEPPKDLQISGKERMSEAYNLEDQIAHKAAFITEHIPDDKKIILIGHSIGCYMILGLFKRIPNLPVLKAILLFPVVERLAQAPNATLFGVSLLYLRWPGIALVHVAAYLPECLKWLFITVPFWGKKIPKCAFQGALNLFNPYVANSAIYMGACEMKEVVYMDVDNIRNHLPKLLFYYGATDGWCPVDYYYDAKALFPDGDIRLCKRGVAHAFVLESSELMADLVWNWMKAEILSAQ